MDRSYTSKSKSSYTTAEWRFFYAYFKGKFMAEPVSGTGVVLAVKVWGLVALLAVVTVLAWLVVVMTRMPRTRQEWVVSLITTVVGSITGGALVVQRFGLHNYADNWFGMCALGGIFFISGLPVWAAVRWTFNWVNARDDANIFDVVREVKDVVKDIKGDRE